MIPAADAQLRAKENLGGFPPQIIESYTQFAATGEPARLDEVVLGVLHFHLAKRPETPLTALPGSMRLREDLGVDSLTMMDTAFLAESLFGIKLLDDELGRITTLDELREHIRQRVGRVEGQKT